MPFLSTVLLSGPEIMWNSLPCLLYVSNIGINLDVGHCHDWVSSGFSQGSCAGMADSLAVGDEGMSQELILFVESSINSSPCDIRLVRPS